MLLAESQWPQSADNRAAGASECLIDCAPRSPARRRTWKMSAKNRSPSGLRGAAAPDRASSSAARQGLGHPPGRELTQQPLALPPGHPVAGCAASHSPGSGPPRGSPTRTPDAAAVRSPAVLGGRTDAGCRSVIKPNGPRSPCPPRSSDDREGQTGDGGWDDSALVRRAPPAVPGRPSPALAPVRHRAVRRSGPWKAGSIRGRS